MLDLSPIANAIKSAQGLLPQAQPSPAEEMKPVPQAETEVAVPPPPAKGGEAGLGEHLDLYDTEASRIPVPPKDPKDPKAAGPGHPSRTQPPPAELAPYQPKAVKAEKPGKEVPRLRTELLGDKSDEPPHTVDAEFPFLKPLHGIPLGRSVDVRI